MEIEGRGWAATQTPPKRRLCLGWEAVMRKRNALGETEADAEVILADTVIATILLKGKLQENRI